MAAPSEKTRTETHRKSLAPEMKRKTGAPPKNAGRSRAAKTSEAVKESARRQLGRQVSQELLKLRPLLKDAGTALLDRLDGDLAGLAHLLNGGSLAGDSPVLPKAPVLSAMLADIKALRVKPKKGRVKDLRRIEAMLESLGARIPPGA
ncbi:MAG TPA: hypothetical protein VLT62_01280 [Candidatus Methylomirabilis sp.]|nr:hypothetical protein [Candidatus Methylomirabilis sp.]